MQPIMFVYCVTLIFKQLSQWSGSCLICFITELMDIYFCMLMKKEPKKSARLNCGNELKFIIEQFFSYLRSFSQIVLLLL